MKRKVTIIMIVFLILAVMAICTGFGSSFVGQPESRPASNEPKTLISSSQWEEQEGDQRFVYESKTYVYD